MRYPGRSASCELVDNERIHEKEAGRPGRPPCKRRGIIKCLLLIELLHCVIQESWSLLNIFKDILGPEKVPRPRTLYQYRADPEITATLQRLQRTAARDLWMKERTAAMDPTGNPLAKGKMWRADRADPKKYREYDKAHYMVGVESLVIPYTKVTRGTWHEAPFFEEFLAETVPGSNIEKVTGDPAFVSVRNYEVAHEYGVTPYIKPKDNAVFRPHPANDYEAHVFFATRFPERWGSVYRWRVKAECAIHSKKAVFGDVVRGPLRSSRRNQEICRDIVHNIRMSIMDRYGGRPRFMQQVVTI
ncbi:MAG: hypothetical protein ACUVT7_01140 [Thermoplasmata archaeon]